MKFILDNIANYHFVDYITIIFIICTSIVVVANGIKSLYSYLNSYYNKRQGKESEGNTIEENTKQILLLSEKIDDFANLMNRQYLHLEKRLDEQKEQIETIECNGSKRDCAILRDRILSGLRYFAQNVDEHGKVHISFTDYENMIHLFEEYFNAHGNGTVKKIYDNEFCNWIIDR